MMLVNYVCALVSKWALKLLNGAGFYLDLGTIFFKSINSAYNKNTVFLD